MAPKKQKTKPSRTIKKTSVNAKNKRGKGGLRRNNHITKTLLK
jgi:hypothetical protein